MVNADGTLKSFRILYAADQQADRLHRGGGPPGVAPPVFPADIRSATDTIVLNICIRPGMQGDSGGVFSRMGEGKAAAGVGRAAPSAPLARSRLPRAAASCSQSIRVPFQQPRGMALDQVGRHEIKVAADDGLHLRPASPVVSHSGCAASMPLATMWPPDRRPAPPRR